MPSESATPYSHDRLRQVLADNWAPCRLLPRRCCLLELITITQKFPLKTSTATWLYALGKPTTGISWNAEMKGSVTLRAVDVLFGRVNDGAQHVASLESMRFSTEVQLHANTSIWWGRVNQQMCIDCILSGEDRFITAFSALLPKMFEIDNRVVHQPQWANTTRCEISVLEKSTHLQFLCKTPPLIHIGLHFCLLITSFLWLYSIVTSR